MKSVFYKLMAGLIIVCVTGCDSGDIYPEEVQIGMTRTVSVNLSLSGVNTVPGPRENAPDKYERKLVLAAYNNNSETPLTLTHIKENVLSENTDTTINISYVSSSATKIVLSILDQSNGKIYDIKTEEITTGEENLALNWGNINLVSFNRVQAQLFNQSCITCHKAEEGSAGLSLDESSSYSMLVDKPSVTDANYNLVKPGNANASMIYKRLTDEEIGHYNHTTLSTLKTNDVELLKEWILKGAKK